jgi:spermidine synthase
MLAFALAIFTSAFLLFQIQPLIAKFILPWFGGGPAVWGISMLFFQSCLVAGYAYAHLLVRYLRPRQQAIVHIVLLLAALTQIPVSPSESFEFAVAADPTLQILVLLTRTIGIPFFVLAATAPLIQAWVSRAKATANPYRLYALSNAASLLALLSYPFVVEPLLTRQMQTLVWSVVFVVFIALCAYCAFSAGFRSQVTARATPADPTAAVYPQTRSWILWLALPAAAVALLLSVTNQLTRDLVSVPFLWVLPLSVYLLSFIICFDSERWYRRGLFLPGMVLCIVAMLFVLSGADIPVLWAIFVFTLALFVLCMVCHGELYRLRPDPAHLTGFYLMIAFGGALGSALVTVLMPIMVDRYLELQLSIAGVALLTVILLARDVKVGFSSDTAMSMQGAMLMALVVTAGLLIRSAREEEPDVVYQTRNFYGVLTVGLDNAGTDREALWLRHGNSYHGVQFTSPIYRSRTTAYYAPDSGVAFAMNFAKNRPSRRIGMVGLGVGTIAAYAKSGDYINIYEINPAVVDVAETKFSFLSDTGADLKVVLGDARMSLERESPQAFDIFVLDAFSSDSIPVHLLTREAFDLYLRHLAPDGVIAVLISSWHFDFEPLLQEMAAELGMNAVLIRNASGAGQNWGSRWMILTRNASFISQKRFQEALQQTVRSDRDVRLWTDDFSSPFQLLK